MIEFASSNWVSAPTCCLQAAAPAPLYWEPFREVHRVFYSENTPSCLPPLRPHRFTLFAQIKFYHRMWSVYHPEENTNWCGRAASTLLSPEKSGLKLSPFDCFGVKQHGSASAGRRAAGWSLLILRLHRLLKFTYWSAVFFRVMIMYSFVRSLNVCSRSFKKADSLTLNN